ncbi:hypothetical protein ACFPME_00075 [Rhodanobacter umsongensis]|uniref:TetR family transcriptional regulator n=1 Tax=Rhodanobacter umsongensis TaxID=633153 RepID=A0ABW0JFV9_9GAMM
MHALRRVLLRAIEAVMIQGRRPAEQTDVLALRAALPWSVEHGRP